MSCLCVYTEMQCLQSMLKRLLEVGTNHQNAEVMGEFICEIGDIPRMNFIFFRDVKWDFFKNVTCSKNTKDSM